AGLGPSIYAVDADQVAQIKELRQRPTLLADLLLSDHDLDLARRILHMQKMGPAHDTAKDDAAGHPDALDARRDPVPPADAVHVLLGVVIEGHFRRQCPHISNGLAVVESTAPRIDAEFLDPAQFVCTASLKNVLRFWHDCWLSSWEDAS